MTSREQYDAEQRVAAETEFAARTAAYEQCDREVAAATCYEERAAAYARRNETLAAVQAAFDAATRKPPPANGRNSFDPNLTWRSGWVQVS